MEGRMVPVRLYLNTPLMAHPHYPFPWPWSSLSIPPGVEHCYINDRGLEISSRFATGTGRGGGEKNDYPQKTGRRDNGGHEVEEGGRCDPLRQADMRTACNLRQHKKVKEVSQRDVCSLAFYIRVQTETSLHPTVDCRIWWDLTKAVAQWDICSLVRYIHLRSET